MRAIRSLLWIGRGEGLAECGIADAPTLDVTWVPDVEAALKLPPLGLDGVVLEGEDTGRLRRDVGVLRRRQLRAPILICLRDRPTSYEATAHRLRELAGAGAAEVLMQARGEGAPPLLEELLECVDRLAKGGGCARGGSTPDTRPVEATDSNAGPEDRSLVGTSRAMRDVFALVERAWRSNATVLIGGETGSGKERIARRIHEGSGRGQGAFVAINCAAFPETLLESELFGHRKGAFTGATRDREGLFQRAHRGTLFLDEIGETSPLLQAKLLRVLQEREIQPLGGARPVPIDVRVIAASNRPLMAEVEAGRFREDLFYRLAVFPIRVPALRERREDVIPLAEHFLEVHGQREGKPGCRLSAATQRLLQTHNWPGNVRELENEMQRALALCEAGELITPARLSGRILGLVEAIDQAPRGGETLRETMDRIEGWLIKRALEHNGGRKTLTAQRLGVTREGLYKKLKRLGVE